MSDFDESEISALVQSMVNKIISDSLEDLRESFASVEEPISEVGGLRPPIGIAEDKNDPPEESPSVDAHGDEPIVEPEDKNDPPEESPSVDAHGDEPIAEPEDIGAKLLKEERGLQASRQVYAIFDAMGPGKAPKKCEKPFTGRMQEVYQDCVTSTLTNHAHELMQGSLIEKFDSELSAIEALFILKGLTKAMNSKVAPFPEEMTVMKSWHMELEAFEIIRDGVIERQGHIVKKCFDRDNLSFMVEYSSSVEEKETLSFGTCRRGKKYNIVITTSTGSVDVQLEAQETKWDFNLNMVGLNRAVNRALKKEIGARKLVRDGFWKFLDKLEEKIEMNSHVE